MVPWPRTTWFLLVGLGLALALLSFIVVLIMPTIPAAAGVLPSSTASNGEPAYTALLALLSTDSATADRTIVSILAFLIALPLVWLPLAVARVFRRARAGYALVMLPPLMWLINNGTILVGTEYGLIDDESGLRVSASFGISAAMLFLTLSLGLLLSTYRLRGFARLAALALLLALTVASGAFGWVNGIVAATTLGVVLWRSLRTPWRGLASVLISAGAAAIAIAAHIALANAVAVTPAMIDSAPSTLQNALLTIKHFGAMITLTLVGVLLAFTRRVPQRRSLTAALVIALPALIAGIAYATLTGPSVFHFALLSAALGYLCAITLGALVWSVTSMPSHVRTIERTRISGRATAPLATPASAAPAVEMSVVVPTRNGTDVLEETLSTLGQRLNASDEIIVVENGSTDGTTDMVRGIQNGWQHPAMLTLCHSDPGLGEALRVGVLTSRGRRLLLTADDLPFGFTDLDEFERLPDATPVAIGSKAHPDSAVTRSTLRTIQSKIFRFLRSALLQSRVGDSQGTLWVDGAWGREFAKVSRESGLMWTTELVLAAEQQGHVVAEVPVRLVPRHETGSSRFRVADAWRSFVGFARLAVYKDDYCDEDWARSTRPDAVIDA